MHDTLRVERTVNFTYSRWEKTIPVVRLQEHPCMTCKRGTSSYAFAWVLGVQLCCSVIIGLPYSNEYKNVQDNKILINFSLAVFNRRSKHVEREYYTYSSMMS
jgi:hypothetical protein